MSLRLLAILYPIWIMIMFNLFISALNMVGMALDLRGWFIDWYLGEGRLSGFLMICLPAWLGCAAWSAYNGVTFRAR